MDLIIATVRLFNPSFIFKALEFTLKSLLTFLTIVGICGI